MNNIEIKIRYCNRCGKEILDLIEHPNARMCSECREYKKKQQSVKDKMRLCRRCGGEITDLNEFPNAMICAKCRSFWGNPNMHTTLKYGGFVKKYVDKMGWPNFVTPAAIVQENPDILGVNVITKSGKILKKSGKVKIVSVCLANIVSDDGKKKYVRYSDACLHLEKI